MIRTTVELPEALLTAAKKRAADLRRPLRELIEDGLRAQLSDPRGPSPRRRRIHWVTAAGGLPPGMDLASRAAMHAVIRRGK